jgi:diguanylate cyclase (GGDEF)-like protein
VDWPHYIEQERLFDIATEELGRILALERSHQLLYQQAIRDPLTGLYNRRHMTELLRSEMEEARRFRQPLSLLALDLDRFKEINDRFGHGTGDQVLVIAAQRMAFGLRKVDRLARIGGEEFLVLCPRTDLDGAALLAERIRESIAEGPVPGLPEEQRITVSLGVATLKEGESAEAFIDRADRRLYEAKAQGRNRVVSTTEG